MNDYYSITAPAKLNLNLIIKGKADNGLHLLNSEVCFLELADKIYFKYSKNDTFLQTSTNKSFVIDSKENIIIETLNNFRCLTGWNKKFQIYLHKKIPIGGGLGGGSADAAATLILLRKLFNKETKSKKISLSNLYDIASKLGSDVPACLESKSLTISGYGNKIKRNLLSSNYYYLLVNPNIKLSTKKVFSHFSCSNKKTIDTNIIFENINIYNSLLSSAIDLVPQIQDILSFFKNIPDIVAYGMSGSGSTCFGIFNDKKTYLPIYDYFEDNYFIWCGKKKDYNVNRVTLSKMLENKF